MNLKEFVKESLVQIIGAIAEAGAFAESDGGEINPASLEWREDQGHLLIYDAETGQMASLVEFDIAITTTEGTEKGAEGGIKVLGMTVGASAHADAKSENQSQSRLKFSVAVVFPGSKQRPQKQSKKKTTNKP